MKTALIEKIKKIRLLILDVDGVLTNGKIIFNDLGKEIKVFDVQDGFGIVLFRKAGYKVAILSARSAPAVKKRAKDLKIDKVCQDAYPKIKAYKKVLRELKLRNEEVCFMGDDLPDLEVLKKVGFSVAVSNAVVEVKRSVDYITANKGGDGAIREVIELILKTQGRWRKIVQSFS